MIQRVALLLPNLAGGGAERVFLELAREIRTPSCEVDLVLAAADGPLLGNIPPGTRVVDLGAPRMARCLPSLRRYLKDRRPDILLSAITHANALAIVACRTVRPRVPVVVTVHNTLSSKAAHAASRLEKLTPFVARLIYPHADRIVAVSEGVANDLVAVTGIRRDRVDVAYNPVVSERLLRAGERRSNHRWLTSKEGPVILAIGRLTEQKDFQTLLRAVALLPRAFRLIVLGEGHLRDSLDRLTKDLGISDRVEFPGFVDNPYSFLGEADVFVLSSRWEGLPTVLIEALPFDIAIVSTDCPSGPREILDNGRWGTIVRAGDERELADAIASALFCESRRPSEAWAPYVVHTATQRYVEILADSQARSRC